MDFFKTIMHTVRIMQPYFWGGAGFGALFAADFLRWRDIRFPVRTLAAVGYGLVLSAVLWPESAPKTTPLFPLSVPSGMMIEFSSALLLIYSVFVEIPLARRRSAHPADRVVRSGTYSFSRHPGLLWFALLQAGIALRAGTGEAVLLAVYLTFLDFLLVLGQDRFFFPRFFTDYPDYKKQVPFLIRLR
jgi:protein-S-isoprenylcysteine O-methyltransferase Ste14